MALGTPLNRHDRRRRHSSTREQQASKRAKNSRFAALEITRLDKKVGVEMARKQEHCDEVMGRSGGQEERGSGGLFMAAIRVRRAKDTRLSLSLETANSLSDSDLVRVYY